MAVMGSKYNINSASGKLALNQLDAMKVGEVLSFPLNSLPAKVKWELKEKTDIEGKEGWIFQGSFCKVPFYKLSIAVEGEDLSMKVTELE